MSLESFHFHYYGKNTKIEFQREIDELDGAFHTTYTAIDDNLNQIDNCLIGTTGKRFSVEVIKRKMLELNSGRWTLTLDCCRNDIYRGAQAPEKLILRIP